jgi:hypothetical protein
VKLGPLLVFVPMNFKSLRGMIDFWSQDARKFYPWGFAMNGQTARLEATRQLIYALGIERIVETGTYRGTTTEWFGQFGIPVETVEANERYYSFSRARLSALKNVAVKKGSSVSFLCKRAPSCANTLFYLDAHWQGALPLREELQIILGRYPNAVVLIDDFQVIGDPGYSFDSYGADKELTMKYVQASALPNFWTFFPGVPSERETGARRGWVVITSSAQFLEKLRGLSLLREFNVPNVIQMQQAEATRSTAS